MFHIEEDAYETLRNYMIDIKRHFSQSEDSGEILQDIENRIAEMFNERIQLGRKEVISIQDVNEVIAQMGRVSDFEDADDFTEVPPQENKTEEPKKLTYTERKLMRDPDDTVLGGVSSGLGHYFGLQPKWMRIIFVLFFLFGGSGVLLYVILWIVMPVANSRADKMAMRGEEQNLQNFKRTFEEEMDHFKPSISNAKSHISKGVKAVGSGAGSLFRIFGRLIGFIALFVCGATIFGMFITLLGFISGILGYQDQMIFPGTEIFPAGQAVLAVIAGVMAITIPFIALFHLLLRLLFRTGPMNNYTSLSLWAGWILSIILVLFFVMIGSQEFRESSTVKVEKSLQKMDVYHFEEKDIRVIDGSKIKNENKKFEIQLGGEELSSYLRSDINIKFEYLEEGQSPFIQYNYFAKGKSRHDAAERASRLNYSAEVNSDKISFNSHFPLSSGSKYRDQSVSVVVYLPVGSKVVLDESLMHKMWTVEYGDCYNSYEEDERLKETEWVMKKSGLTCAPNFVSKKSKSKEEVKNVEEEVKKLEELAEEKKKEAEKIKMEATKLAEEASSI